MRPAALVPQPSDPTMSDENSPAPKVSHAEPSKAPANGGGRDLIPMVILIAMLGTFGYGAYAYIFEDPNAGSEIDRSQLYVVEYAVGEEPDGATGPTQIWESGSSEEGSEPSED